jgi:CBS domain-containing protein
MGTKIEFTDGRTRVEELMTAHPAYCRENTPLPEVARLMVDHDCGCIPVLDDDDHPIGVITDRDIACRVVARDLDARAHVARDCMSEDCVTVPRTASTRECLDKLEDHQIRRAIVVEDDGTCCGIVAQADVARRDEQLAAELVARVSEPSEPARVF